MGKNGNYTEYARHALDQFAGYPDARRYMLVDAVKGREIKRVLDVGCGAGQEMLAFAERTEAFCVGVDVAEEVGAVGFEVFREFGFDRERVAFVRAGGENLPFDGESFDVVICRVALPYMDNRKALGEISRVLRPKGKFILKTHAPRFYFGMLRRRFGEKSLKSLAYPLVSLVGGAWHSISGRQPRGGFWRGKEIFQTEGFLRRALAENNLQIKGHLPDTNPETPSYLIEKN